MDVFKKRTWTKAAVLNLITEGNLPAPARYGFLKLTQALEYKGIRYSITHDLGEPATPSMFIGVVGADSDNTKIHSEISERLSNTPEAYCIKSMTSESATVKIIAGRDAKGLMYALLDVARTIELAPKSINPFLAIKDVSETPFLRIRGMTIHLFNRDLEKQWYYEKTFWQRYFEMLALHRFNTFALTFADHTTYLNPPYPYLLDVPEFPMVKARHLRGDDQNRNLEMLRYISDLASNYGIDFTFAIWMQCGWLPELGNIPELSDIQVDGLPEYPREYCAVALNKLLVACPNIKCVQFRVNRECGISEQKQTDFFSAQFKAIRNSGRRMRVDLRLKGLRRSTIQAALSEGLEVIVSTKYWQEHMGLPYHPATIDNNYRDDNRYGYGDILSTPRCYEVMYRLWSVGSHRLLLWGDPEYAARFSRSCKFGGGVGFEVFAPLSNKGYGDAPGDWCIFVDPTYESYDYEYERYWMFYLVFGRFGYNPDCGPEIYRRELSSRFQRAAGSIERAYCVSGKIIPFITATRMASASEWRIWHELEPGHPLEDYAMVQPGDTSQFYAIRGFRETTSWNSENWQEDISGYVEDAMRGAVNGKWTPFHVSMRLRQLAYATHQSIADAERVYGRNVSSEFKATVVDCRVSAFLAEYHAEKILAATHLGFYRLGASRGRLLRARGHIEKAAVIWKKIVHHTEGVYNRKLVFGQHTPALPYQGTHWIDFVPMVEKDVDHVVELLEKDDTSNEICSNYAGETSRLPVPRLEVICPKSVQRTDDIPVRALIEEGVFVEKAVIHYRAVNNKLDWLEAPMNRYFTNEFSYVIHKREIPDRWDIMFYIELLVPEGGGWLWPSWEQDLPYKIIELERQKEG